jgi:succinate-semialdehyde dehydrogenase/glutarate-semialdehyde dehydrogenase
MNEELFRPVAPVTSFRHYKEAVAESNRVSCGLTAYAYTRSAKTIAFIGASLESGTVSIIHDEPALPEVPFGGIKDSRYGSAGRHSSL